jgi:putative transposase
LDIFSRSVVGWTVAHAEQAALAERLLATTCAKQQILPHALTGHADRGSSMTSKPVASCWPTSGSPRPTPARL